MHPLIGLALLLLIGLTLALSLGVVLTVRTLRRPPRRAYAWAVAKNRPGDPSELSRPEGSERVAYESWTLASPAGELPVWDITGAEPSGPVIIATHGWGESRIVALSRIGHLLPLASRIVAWDLPGHGDAPGATSLGAREHQDLLRLIERVRKTTERPIVLYGSSLGAGVAIAASAEADEPLPVIAEAPYCVPFTPARNVLRQAGYPYRATLPLAMAYLGLRLAGTPAWLSPRSRIAFDRAALASRMDAPLLVVEGEHDAVSPVEDARRIAEHAPDGTLALIEGAGHLDLWEPPNLERTLGAVRAFVARTAGASPAEREAPNRSATPSV